MYIFIKVNIIQNVLRKKKFFLILDKIYSLLYNDYMSKRNYSFNIVTYVVDENVIIDFCRHCKKYAYVLHDRDEGKSLHYHIICSFDRNKSFNSVRALLPSDQNTLIKPLFSRQGSYRYLTHKDDPDKYQYSDDCIHTNDVLYFSKDEVKYNLETFLVDIQPCTSLPLVELAKRYGKDFIRNKDKYMQFGKVIEKENIYLQLGYNPELITPIDPSVFWSDIFMLMCDRLLSLDLSSPSYSCVEDLYFYARSKI